MKLLSVKKSDNPKKKWMAIFCDCKCAKPKCKPEDRKKIHFGAAGYEDYTIHKDKERRRLYRIRHAKEKDQPPNTPGALSYHLLWGESTSLQENIKTFKEKYNA